MGDSNLVLTHGASSMLKMLALQCVPCMFVASVLFQTLVEGEGGQWEC